MSWLKRIINRRQFLSRSGLGIFGAASAASLIPPFIQFNPQNSVQRTVFLNELKGNRGLKVVLLGTGGPDIDPWDIRGGTTEIIIIDEEAILVDCGFWVVERLIQGPIKPWSIDNLFITHSFHYDHFVSYPTFLFIRNGNTAKPLNVYGPRKTKRRSDLLLKEVWDDDPRAQRTLTRNQVKVTEILDEGLFCEGKNWKAYSTFVRHSEGNAVGFRIDTHYGSVGISGDIRDEKGGLPDENLTKLVKGVDLFIVDADEGHSAPEKVGEACRDSEAEKVILTHLHNRAWRQGKKNDYSNLVNTVKSMYKGEVILAQELLEIKLA